MLFDSLRVVLRNTISPHGILLHAYRKRLKMKRKKCWKCQGVVSSRPIGHFNMRLARLSRPVTAVNECVHTGSSLISRYVEMRGGSHVGVVAAAAKVVGELSVPAPASRTHGVVEAPAVVAAEQPFFGSR